MHENVEIEQAKVLAALARVTGSATFSQAEKPREFLEFVVRHAAGGDATPLKETTIGVGLYHRDPGYDPKVDGVVRTLARRVRERLERYYREEGAADPLVIEIPKGGYSPTFSSREVVSPALPESEAVAVPPPQSQSFPLYSVGAGLVTLVVVLAGLLIYRQSGTEKPVGSQGPRALVLPFRSSVNSAENQLYGNAMSDSIVASLTGIPGLTILNPPSAVSAEQASKDEDAILAARTKADYLITGQFDRTHGMSTMFVKLTQVSTGEAVWSRRYEFPWAKLLSTEEAMSAEAASRLSLRLGKEYSTMVSHIPATSAQAQREYLNGLYFATSAKKNLSLNAFATGVSHLERALEIDPGFVDAHAALAGLLAFRAMPWTSGNTAFLEGAERHARLALERAPRNSDALAALARCAILRRDFAAGFSLAGQAVEAEPGNTEALSALAEVYYAAGFYEAALQAYLEASKDGYVAMEPFAFGSILAARLGKLDVAEKLVQQHGKADPDSVVHSVVQGYLLGWKGDLAGSEKHHRRVHELVAARDTPSDVKRTTYGFAAVAHAQALIRLGDLPAARRILKTLPPPQPRRLADEIILLSSIGESAKALQAIESSFHWRNYRFLVTEPELKPLHSLPQFQRLLERTYSDWLAITAAHADTALAKPPELPTPAEFLRVELSYRK